MIPGRAVASVLKENPRHGKADFLEARKPALVAGRSGPPTREEQLEAEVADLTQALGEAAVQLRVWKKSAGAVWAL